MHMWRVESSFDHNLISAMIFLSWKTSICAVMEAASIHLNCDSFTTKGTRHFALSISVCTRQRTHCNLCYSLLRSLFHDPYHIKTCLSGVTMGARKDKLAEHFHHFTDPAVGPLFSPLVQTGTSEIPWVPAGCSSLTQNSGYATCQCRRVDQRRAGLCWC